MIYYKSNELSNKLNINLSKWKRWSRDFLPPDPLGGLQSGVARQFNLKDAFKVYFGGYLVGELKLTIPDAVQVVSDLYSWMKKNGFYNLQPQVKKEENGDYPRAYFYLHSCSKGHFVYTIRTIMAHTQSGTEPCYQETFTLTHIGTETDPLISGQSPSAYIIAISTLYQNFLRLIA
ncbi:MAG: hypothetical protein WAU91_22815 [Desulfatitalea sp.]